MSKKILFLSSAKLTAMSFGLLLAIFCTIGMSFTPVEEVEVIEINDSTSVSPQRQVRKSHWNGGGCNESDSNNNDYARTSVVTMGHGIVSIKNTTKNGSLTSITTKTSTNVAGNEAVITWNCNKSTSGHTNSFELTATPDEGYYFAGWSTSNTSNTASSTENPWTIPVTIPHGEKGTSQNSEWENSNNPYPTTYYGYFAPITYVDVTFAPAPEGCSYDITVGGNTQTVTTSNVVKTHITEAKLSNPVASSGYVFAGWYQIDGSGNVVDITSASPTIKFSENVTLGARFISTTSLPKFKNITKNAEYYGLRLAILAASANDVIIPVAEETVVDGSDLLSADNGIYTIPSGVKLLIPYSSANDFQTLPKVVTSTGTLSAYRKLILMDGVNVVVSSGAQICIGGQAMAASGSATDGATGYTTGACGVLDMSRGGHLELNNGSTLYCWGFVKGQDMDQGNNTIGVGTITVNSGATVWENFSVGDWRGGSATSSIVNTRFFPFQSYFMQNIEVPTTFWHGSSEWCYFTLNATGGPYDTKFAVIGSSNCLFKLTDAQSKVRTWYDPTTDLMCYELSGSAILDELKIKITGIPFIGTIDIQSSQFDLPITSNMHLILADCTMNLTKPLIIQPGAIIEIKNNATVTLTNSIYLYDKDDWGPWVNGKYFKSRGNLTTHKNRGNGASNEFLDDAKFIIDGSFTISSAGKLFSTAGGAALVGNGGGTLAYPSSLSGSSTLTWYKSTTTSGDGETGTVAVNNANPCNEDESYTKAIASTTFYNVHGRWFKSGNQNENTDHTYNFTYIASGAVSGTGGTDVSPNTHNAVYAPDKTGLTAGMKWCNVAQDGTCSNIFNATQALNETPASDIRYTYPSSSWLQLLRTETEGVYGGSDNSLYAVEGCAVNSLGSVDENCLYTINEVKKALVDGHFVALEKNTEDEAWHDVANPTNYYISFEGCNWHPATKYAGEEKAYIVEEGDYIWYNNDWLLVEREDPFFFDYNEQNVKRYYEYEDGAWVLASPRVRVVDAIETRDFYKLPEAITVASGKKNATITILKDIAGINTEMTYTAKNTTCTLDLNGHIVSGACAKLLTINASGSTFTITDNTIEKNGRLENIYAQNAVTYNVTVTAGTLNLNAGTIYAQNLHQYRYKKGASDNVASMGTRAVQVAAAQRFNITGGRVEANGKYEVYGIAATGSAANQTVVDISGTGEVYAEGALNTYGIACGGKLNLKAGLVEAHLNSSWANSYNTEGSDTDKKAHATCRAITMSAKANATASSCYYGTLTVTGGTIKASTDAILALSYTSNVYGVYMNINVAGLGNRNFASTSGTNAQQASSIGSIKNAEIIVDNKANYGYGISVYGHYNSYNNSNSVFKVENTTVDVKAYYYAYGIYACGDIDGTTGECYTGDVELTNCTVTAEATTADYAYATYVYAGQKTIYKDKQANYYGEYATAAKMTINSGTYTAKTKKSTAYAVATSTRAKTIYDPETSVEASRTLGEGKEAYPTLIIKDGTFTAEATTTTARAVSSGGNTTITGGTFKATATKYYSYGLYAVAGTLTASNITVNATAKGRVSSSDNNAYAYGVFADCGIISSGNQAWTGYTYASDVTLNNCTVNATATTYNNARGLCVNAKSALLTQANYEAQKTTSGWSAATWAAYQAVFPGDNTGRAIAARATVNGGTFTATAAKATAYGALSTQTALPANKEVTASPEMTLKNATFIATTGTSTTAYGVQCGGPTLIDGCTITATAGNPTFKSTASGVRALDKTTTIKNSTITATATDAAYGLEGYVEINATHGYCWHGEFDLSEAGTTEVTAEAKTSGKKAWSVYLQATNKNIASGNFAGDYATAANATINGGTYKAIASGSGASAYCLSIAGKKTQGSVVAQPEVEVLDGFFNGATAEVGTAGVVGHMQLKGGYFVHNTNLATYAVAPKSVWTLPTTHEHYNPYYYKIAEHYNIVFMNGTTQLQQKDMEVGSIPAYTSTPTKDADAQYTYTFDGWSTTDGGDKLASLPAVSADATYFAHYSKTEKKYTVNVLAGEHGSVSPASVSGIGCVTASGNITATPNTGYRFANWTLPTGVTAADGYTSESNPIHIHATASGKTITANFAAKTYTVTLDNQSATTAGAASVTATYNEAMPSIAANLPARTGYAFGGYFTETNGGGTQYYNADGTSAHIWDIDAVSPTLYAKWTSSETGFYVDIVDVDNSAKTLTLNTNSWASSGWGATGYVINGTHYLKTKREIDRTLIIPYTGEAGESFTITIETASGTTVSLHNYIIPTEIKNNASLGAQQVVYVKNNATLTVNANKTVKNIYVAPGAKLVVNSGVTLEADTVFLRTTPWESAELELNGTITGQVCYTRIISKKDQYYQFGLPMPCPIAAVRLSDGSTPKYGGGWLLRSYSEQHRAQNGSGADIDNWVTLTNEGADVTIQGGVGYEMFSNSGYYREYYFPVAHTDLSNSVSVTRTEGGKAGEKHAGWNIVVSPLMSAATIESVPEGMKVSWLQADGSYWQRSVTEIKPAIPFSYQATANGSISFAQLIAAPALRRVAATEEPVRIQWMQLDILNATGLCDQTEIYSHPARYEQRYQTGIDVAKQSFSASRALIYSSHVYGDMAFAGVADSLLERGVAMTVYSPSAQELTISMRENDWLDRMAQVWLVDHETGARTDLLASDYTFDAAAGTTAGRFTIEGVFRAPQVTTDVDNGQWTMDNGQGTKAKKLILRDKMYILVGDTLYDATGRLVK
ncbi:MAG: InlB B-repeat-containing protein [Paludibacteraceae bacterium]|nr:InlB B-repeat-containing protein [Paludibacteraceae bacterium]